MMATRHYTFTLNSTTATQITGIQDLNNRRGVTIVINTDKNNAKPCFFGTSAVTSTDFGWHADADNTLVLSGEFTKEDEIWAITDSGSPKVHVLIIGG